MSLENRQRIIHELQEIRDTRIITHINSDRRALGLNVPALSTKLGTEAQPYFYKLLKCDGKSEELDFYLYTTGGQTDSVWPLVSILREYTSKLNVIVPYKAHSAGTLICLGSDEVLLSEMSELSPVDPTTGNQFNPLIENGQDQRKMISVEDVSSYFMFAKNPSKLEGKDDNVDIDLVFELLAKKVHPLALGKVHRSHTQIRELARRLLDLSTTHNLDKDSISDIVNTLTQGRYSHTDILNRREAKKLLGENRVLFSNNEEQELIWELFLDYENTLGLNKPFVLKSEVGDNNVADLVVYGGFIESKNTSYVFRAALKVYQRSRLPSGVQLNLQPNQQMPIIPGLPIEFQIELADMGWVENSEGI